MTNVLVFIVVIVVLILIHELGHFIAAKLSGMRVDEFGLGYPPRALTLGKIGETEYTINWLPFGGFVKIFGEDGNSEGSGVAHSRAFSDRPRILQAIVLLAGIAMNLIFAYVLLTGALVMGTPRALSPGEITRAEHKELAVANVLQGSPASHAGLAPGDSILSAHDAGGTWASADSASFTSYIAASKGESITLQIRHNGETSSVTATPKQGIVVSDPTRYALGVEVATIGTVPLSLTEAITEGATLTWETTLLTAQGLGHFFYGLVTFSADLSQVAGPVGIAGVVGSASSQGFGDLLSIMAIISINLALINLIPVPALDGGRLLFVIIEGVIRRPIKPQFAQTVNAIGFALLILLMVVVTAHDIFKIIG